MPARLADHRAGRSGNAEARLAHQVCWYHAVMWVVMTAAEREEFLTGVHVGVLGVAVGTAGRTLAVPVWYGYQPAAC